MEIVRYKIDPLLCFVKKHKAAKKPAKNKNALLSLVDTI